LQERLAGAMMWQHGHCGSEMSPHSPEDVCVEGRAEALPCFRSTASLLQVRISLFIRVGNCPVDCRLRATSRLVSPSNSQNLGNFPVFFPDIREMMAETVSHCTATSASTRLTGVQPERRRRNDYLISSVSLSTIGLGVE